MHVWATGQNIIYVSCDNKCVADNILYLLMYLTVVMCYMPLIIFFSFSHWILGLVYLMLSKMLIRSNESKITKL